MRVLDVGVFSKQLGSLRSDGEARRSTGTGTGTDCAPVIPCVCVFDVRMLSKKLGSLRGDGEARRSTSNSCAPPRR